MSSNIDRVPPQLQAHLDTGCTTLAHCWRITRGDGVALGFTDHDEPLTFEGLTFDPQTGAETTEIQARTGLSVDNAEISGALLGDGLAEDDLASGLYDGAKVETWLVNWRAVEQRTLIASGHFGSIKRMDGAWQVEVRGLGDELSQTRGRRYGRHCDARLGDGRCGVNLSDPAHRTSAEITAVNTTGLTLSLPSGTTFDEGSFTHGRIQRLGDGMGDDIAGHWTDHAGTQLEIWGGRATHYAVADQVELTIGCDKSWATCRKRFTNGHNFRGFPHIPGNDFALSTAKESQVHDGSPLVVDHD
ncbi:MAG: DUF2163 domain-containing protein [Pseudomonadota bacterium]